MDFLIHKQTQFHTNTDSTSEIIKANEDILKTDDIKDNFAMNDEDNFATSDEADQIEKMQTHDKVLAILGLQPLSLRDSNLLRETNIKVE
jgi:hypothetical protein